MSEPGWRRSYEPTPPTDGELPESARETPDVMVRRTFLKLLGATAGLASLTACTRGTPAAIVPYVERTPELMPGVPLWYATSLVLDGYATGVLVECHEGHPTKIEGNPDHPASLGATSVHDQAAILGLHDPCRATFARRGQDPLSWGALRKACEEWKDVHFLLEPTSSPLVRELLARIPGAHVHFHAPLASTAPLDAARALLGRPLVARPDLARARRVLALDADFLASGPGHLRHARDFANGRAPDADMNRLYVVEPAPTPTGMTADHRLARRASEVERVGRAILGEVLRLSGAKHGLGEAQVPLSSDDRAFARACASDLWAHRGAACVIAGERQTLALHAVTIALNALLGTALYAEPVLMEGEPLPDSMETLVIVGTNPVHTSPGFTERLARVKNKVRCGLYEDETAQECEWFLPLAHALESWGDARAFDGTISLQQPVMIPREGVRSLPEILGAFLPELPDLATRHEASDLERGFVKDSARPLVAAEMRWTALPELLAPWSPIAGLEVVFARDHAVHDGRFANNPWLQELPDPATKLTWDKAALVSPLTARALGVSSEERVALRRGSVSIDIPVFVLPGHAEDTITIPLGYGRRGAEAIARGVGTDAYPLARGDLFAGGIAIEKLLEKSVVGVPPLHTAARAKLASTQHHGTLLEGSKIVEEKTLAEHASEKPAPRPLPKYREGPQWGMTIDLSKCTGCNACVVGCQAENNVPVVGKEAVRQGRAMHWLRIDRYFAGPESDPRFALEPMLCQHCEKAPCEYVCPVNATTHSPDGINEQTYNRCVGTRFCSNNCPYKVRVFNWFDHSASVVAPNPDVTVRQRGVMEKCTFCVQRVREKEITARREGRKIADGELKTACQQACPARAITFGDLADSSTAVAKSWRDRRRFAVLEELGTQPRVHYLARIRNANPELEA